MSLLKQRALTRAAPSAATAVPVANLQAILRSRGYSVAPDGLYGPRTASAWSTLARSKHLAPTIARVGPKIAKVVAVTYDSLSVPAIP
jgi:peptidoglycan hydrolase-like protein with peptidoglycan-binding domain